MRARLVHATFGYIRTSYNSMYPLYRVVLVVKNSKKTQTNRRDSTLFSTHTSVCVYAHVVCIERKKLCSLPAPSSVQKREPWVCRPAGTRFTKNINVPPHPRLEDTISLRSIFFPMRFPNVSLFYTSILRDFSCHFDVSPRMKNARSRGRTSRLHLASAGTSLFAMVGCMHSFIRLLLQGVFFGIWRGALSFLGFITAGERFRKTVQKYNIWPPPRREDFLPRKVMF